MSIGTMKLVFNADIKDLEYTKNGEKRVAKASTVNCLLLAYADHANDEGEGAYPGYTRLERKTKLSRQGIADTIEACVQNEFLNFEGISKRETNSYCLNIKLLETLNTPVYESSHLTSTSQATLPARVKPLDLKHPLTIPESSIGASAPPNLGLDWQLGHGQAVSQHDFDFQKEAEYRNAAGLIATGTGINSTAAADIALSFMQARQIVIPESKIKGQRKAVKEMLQSGVSGEHVKQAVKKLIEENMTITDLFSVTRTAIDLANPKPESRKLDGTRTSERLNR